MQGALLKTNLNQYQQNVRHCAEALRAALANCSGSAFEENLRLAARSTIALCECPPAAWGDAPAAIARLLLPIAAPPFVSPERDLAEAGFWALNLFGILNGAPTIKRTLVEVSPAMAAGEILSRLRKRVNEIHVALQAVSRGAAVAPHAKIVLQIIDLYVDLLRTAALREQVDLRLFEFIGTDMHLRLKHIPPKESPRALADLVERADAMRWETNRIIQSSSGKRVA
jgi:hypothetical protein